MRGKGIMFAWFRRQWEWLSLTGAWLAATGVAVATGYASWGHIEHVGLMVGEPKAYLLPLAVDGMMLAGAFFALVDRLRGYEPRGWSIVAVWLGSMLTVSFNMLSALERGWAAMAVSAVFAITFLVTVEAAFHPSQVVIGETARAVHRVSRRMIKLAAARTQYAASMRGAIPDDTATPAPATVPVSEAMPAPVTVPAPEAMPAPEAWPAPVTVPVTETAPVAETLPSWATLPRENVDHTSPTAGASARTRRPRKAITATPETGDLIKVTADEPSGVLPPVVVSFSGNGGSMDES